jgi:hypothetical protein
MSLLEIIHTVFLYLVSISFSSAHWHILVFAINGGFLSERHYFITDNNELHGLNYPTVRYTKNFLILYP